MGIYTQQQWEKLPNGRQWSPNEICIIIPPKLSYSKVSGIYKINFKDHFYIGKSTHIVSRASLHACAFRRSIISEIPKNDKISKFLLANSDLYVLYLEVLELCKPKFLVEREQFYLNKFFTDPKCLNSKAKSVPNNNKENEIRY